jgi:protein-disulfide isomerase
MARDGERGVMMRRVLIALAVVVGAVLHASAQGKFIGIDDDPQLGNSDAKVTIIEFGDYQCPSCRAFWRETLPRIKKEYVDTGKVRIVYRDFPIDEIHPEATISAIAANCAGDQGKYFEFHDKVFREQDRRGRDIVRFKTAELKRWATEIGLDAPMFDECVDAGRHKSEVVKDYNDGAGVGISGTPFFFINGRVIAGAQPFGNFRRVIEEELKK